MTFYQGLHDIISDAAYLSLCIRLSPTIFWWEETRPGTLFTAEEHTNVDAVNWQESKNAQLTLHVKDITSWRTRKEKALSAVRKKLAEGKIYSHNGFSKVEQLENIKALRPAFATDAFRAKVKIAVWPAIKRFKEGHWKEEGTSLPAWEKRGMREIPMSTSLVLCYYGRVQHVGEIKPYTPVSLAEYMGLHPTTAQEKAFVERVNEQLFTWKGLGSLGLVALYLFREHGLKLSVEQLAGGIASLGGLVGEKGQMLSGMEEGLLEGLKEAWKS
ncbi:hypothetical protein HYFRA_00010985 [Hymenoscyphus fraxineus]|uniref:Uncharacterized protein n=1 Tax=Hymenoscyphus fraxineus TaxID=746836 RepID=A0A9N9KYA3_9HELO|nr:hypothetical protein HYFRA_00010985 [Hymenoscyphus fraxineus]